MKRLLFAIVDHPVVTTLLVLGITVIFAAALPRLVIDTSAEGLMVKGDPARAFYDNAKKRFGNDTLSIVVIKADDVFAAPVLESVRRVTRTLERMDLVSRVESLTTVRNVKGDGRSLDTEPLVPRPCPPARPSSPPSAPTRSGTPSSWTISWRRTREPPRDRLPRRPAPE